MSAYRPYPKYKPSGVEWLGDVPEEWVVSRIKNVATINASKSEVSHLDPETEISFLPMEAVGDDGSMDTSATRQLGDVLTGYTYVRENDVLVAKITPCFENGKGCIARGLNNGIGFATTEVVPIRPNKRSIPEFLYFLLHGLPFRKVAEGSMYGAGGQKRVSDTFVAGYSFARECGKLDALQAKQERLIELLKEKRQALISHAVTKGLNPDAKLKPSGIEWLGDVPEHWATPQLKFLIVGIDQGKSPECEARIAEPDEWGVMKSGCVNWGIFRQEEHKALPPHIAPIPTTEIRKGDLLMSRASGSTDLIGSVAYVENVRPRLLLSDKIFRLKVSKACDPRFIWRMASTIPVRRQIELSINGAEGLANNITKESIRSLFFTLPPLAEQRAIVAHLDEKCGKIDQLKAKAERGIELLKERRSALISAAVTGKIDVRHT